MFIGRTLKTQFLKEYDDRLFKTLINIWIRTLPSSEYSAQVDPNHTGGLLSY